MSEPFCDGTTHYLGCPCHEARRDAEIARLRALLAHILALNVLNPAESGRVREVLK